MTKERVGSIIFLAFGIYGLALSLQLPMGSWGEPGAGPFPLIVSILLCLSGLKLFFAGQKTVDVDWKTFCTEQRTPFQIVILTVAFIAALDRLGYLLTSTLYLFALLAWVSRYKIWISLAIALSIGIGSWYVFGRLLGTALPEGLLKF
jgi:putative tricarboxylic transport membrane protein